MILFPLQGDQEPGTAGMKEALLVPPRKRCGVRTGLVEDADRKPKVTSLEHPPHSRDPDPEISYLYRIWTGTSQAHYLYIGWDPKTIMQS